MSHQPERKNDSPASPDDPSRRDALRKAGTTLAVVLGGPAAATSPAQAHACPRLPEEWASHPDEWPTFPDVIRLLLLDESGDEQWLHPNDSQTRFLGELGKSADGDLYLRMVEQYVAARLNKRVVRPHPETYDDFWARMSEYNQWARHADRPQREWDAGGVDGRALLSYLTRYNLGIGWYCQREYLFTEHFDVITY